MIASVLAAAAACTIASPMHTVALVELYTSQGCSSCPPADRWLSELPRQVPADRAVPLALHVGYWDYIGWKDPFARREFNARQRWLAGLNHNRTVYTPGVFVAAQEWPNWRDRAALAQAIAQVNQRRPAVRIALAASGQATRMTIDVQGESLDPARAAEAELFVALKQHGHATAVARGENRGETLRNDHVVREWRGPLPLGTARLDITLPEDGPRVFEAVAFAQARGSGQVLQAVALPLADCLR
jgi:hypothetical protein